MSGLKGLTKGGWHPKGKDGAKESWRGDFKGVDTVAGWMGKKKPSAFEEAQGHQSTPLNQLRDPSSFGPPPKRNTAGSVGPASPAAGPSSQITPRISKDTGGLGAPLSKRVIEEDTRIAQVREEAVRAEEEAPNYPTGPYRADTTQLTTAHLPKPPVYRGNRGADGEAPIASAKPKPSLPPRLPQRGSTQPPPPAYSVEPGPENGVLNPGALSRLSAAGVSVPGFGVGGAARPPVPSRTSAASVPVPAQAGSLSSPPGTGPQLSELQSRFSKLNTGASATAPSNAGTSTGTTWAQKQAALKTASQFQKDPSSVSLADARSAATTTNSFRERHGEQVASGWKTANTLKQQYGIADRAQGYAGGGASSGAGPGVGKKPPPPPPAKRKDLQGAAPPPINMSSKPSMP